MVTLSDAIAALYPAAIPNTDYRVEDDGTGPRLAHWSPDLGPEPTAEAIAAVTARQVSAAGLARASVAAVGQFAAGMDAITVAVRIIVRDLYTRLNDLRELHGLPRVQEPEHVARLIADAMGGQGAPIDTGG